MIQIAILGHGVVGTGTARMIEDNREQIARAVGDTVAVKYILDIRDLPDSPWADRIVHDYGVILADPEVALVAELIGGSEPAHTFALEALRRGKHVVTSNKECVSRFGAELSAEAAAHGVSYLFEASCGGGIPVVHPLLQDLAANRITEISGILNGTTNYILTKMFREGAQFADALKEAQDRGYAERNPSADVDGHDACRKINILSACVTDELWDDSRIYTEGITAVRTADVAAADRAGYAVKLLGRMTEGYRFVAPHLVPYSCPLSHADDVFNAVLVRGNYVGDVMFYGRGAGAEATASAVVADVVAALSLPARSRVWTREDSPKPLSTFSCPRYLTCDEADGHALLAALPVSARRVDAPEGEVALITDPLSERDMEAVRAAVALRSHLRVWA